MPKKPAPEPSYLVARRGGITTSAGHIAAGDYVPRSLLGESLRRMLRSGAVLDVGPTVKPPPPARRRSGERSAGAVLDQVAAAGGVTPAGDSDVSGVVAQPVPVVLRFLAAYPERAGEVVAAEKARRRPRSTVLDAARTAHERKALP